MDHVGAPGTFVGELRQVVETIKRLEESDRDKSAKIESLSNLVDTLKKQLSEERKTKSELNSKMNAMREEFAKFLSLEDQKTDKPLAVRAKMKALSESLSDGSPVRTGRKPKTPDSSEAKPRLSMPFGTPITTRTATLREEKSRLDRARKSNELTSGLDVSPLSRPLRRRHFEDDGDN